MAQTQSNDNPAVTGIYVWIRAIPWLVAFLLSLATVVFSLSWTWPILAVVIAVGLEVFPVTVWFLPRGVRRQARYTYRNWWRIARRSCRPIPYRDTKVLPGIERIRSDSPGSFVLVLQMPAVALRQGTADYLADAAIEIQSYLRTKRFHAWRTCVVTPQEDGILIVPTDVTADKPISASMAPHSWNVPVGVEPDGSEVTLDLSHPSHMLISGKTRSGKSSFVYGLLNQMRRLPVTVAGVDPTGILFNELGDGWGGDSLRSKRITNDADAAAVVQVLSMITEEMDRRISLLHREHRDKWSRNDFESDPGRRLIIVVIEEYPGLIERLQNIDSARGARSSDRFASKAAGLVGRIAYEGAKVGVVLLLVTQRPDAKIIGGPLRAQLTTRVTFAQDSDGLRMSHPELSSEQVKQNSWAPGVGFIEADGMIPLTRFRSYRAELADLHRPGASVGQIDLIQ